jgi:hypothetical protein
MTEALLCHTPRVLYFPPSRSKCPAQVRNLCIPYAFSILCDTCRTRWKKEGMIFQPYDSFFMWQRFDKAVFLDAQPNVGPSLSSTWSTICHGLLPRSLSFELQRIMNFNLRRLRLLQHCFHHWWFLSSAYHGDQHVGEAAVAPTGWLGLEVSGSLFNFGSPFGFDASGSRSQFILRTVPRFDVGLQLHNVTTLPSHQAWSTGPKGPLPIKPRTGHSQPRDGRQSRELVFQPVRRRLDRRQPREWTRTLTRLSSSFKHCFSWHETGVQHLYIPMTSTSTWFLILLDCLAGTLAH